MCRGLQELAVVREEAGEPYRILPRHGAGLRKVDKGMGKDVCREKGCPLIVSV